MSGARVVGLLSALLAAAPLPDVADDVEDLRRAGRFEDAIERLDAALRRDGDPRLEGLLGLCLLDAARMDRARVVAAQNRDYDGRDYDLCLFLGSFDLRTGKAKSAVRWLQRAVKEREESPEALAALAEAHAGTESFQKAAAIAERLELVDAERGRPLAARMLAAAGDRIAQRGPQRSEAMPRAVEFYARAHAKAPDDREMGVKYFHALLQVHRGREAESLLDRLYPLDANAVAHHYQAGRCAKSAGDVAAARTHLERALALDGQHRGALAELGRLLVDGGEHDRTVALLEPALERYPTFGTFHLLLGLAEEGRSGLDAAEAHLRRAVELEPENGEALYHLGGVLMRLGRPQEGRKFLDRFRRIGG